MVVPVTASIVIGARAVPAANALRGAGVNSAVISCCPGFGPVGSSAVATPESTFAVTVASPRRKRTVPSAPCATVALTSTRERARGILGNVDVQGGVLTCDRHRGGGGGWLELAGILRPEAGRDLVLARDGERQLSGGHTINHRGAGLQGTGGTPRFLRPRARGERSGLRAGRRLECPSPRGSGQPRKHLQR